MNNYENTVSSDTILSAGLIAIAIAWVVLAAVRGPIGSAAEYRASAHPSPSMSTQLPSATAARTVAQPADAQRSAIGKVS